MSDKSGNGTMPDCCGTARIRLQAAPALLLWIGLVYGLVELGTVLGWSSAAWSLSFGLVAGSWVGFWSWWAGPPSRCPTPRAW